MWRRITVILLSVSVLFCAGLVKQAMAQTVLLENSSFTPLYLDQGFMNRAVDLDLPAINLRVRFNDSDIPSPGVLTVITKAINDPGNTNGYGSDVNLYWTTNAPQSPQIAHLTISDPVCGQDGQKVCVIQEVYNGQTIIHEAAESTKESASATIHINATVRLVLIEPATIDLGYMQEGDASWYAYKNCLCAASPDFPKGSYVKVSCLDDDSKSVIVRINDFGPERDIFPERVIDLDKVAFAKLASLGAGVIQVKVEPVAAPSASIAVPQPAIEPIAQPKESESVWEF